MVPNDRELERKGRRGDSGERIAGEMLGGMMSLGPLFV